MHRIYPHSQVPHFKEEILDLRRQTNKRGRPLSFQEIADRVGFSVGAVWTWVKRWENN